jgi:hypothetical protein
MVSVLLRDGIAVKSKLSRLLVAGNFAALIAEPEQVLDMILALGGTLPGKLGVLGLEGGQLELPEMVLEEHLGRIVHATVPDIRLR